jgi:hypothetical protein
MKFYYGALLALVQPITTAAFLAQAPKALFVSKGADTTPTFSYLGSLGAADGSDSSATFSDLATSYYTLKSDTSSRVNGDLSDDLSNGDGMGATVRYRSIRHYILWMCAPCCSVLTFV